MNAIGDIAGRVCEILIPVRGDIFYGNPASPVAVCTLSSMQLLRKLSGSAMMDRVALVGRLLSENRGIDSLIRGTAANPGITTLIVCGRDAPGHMAGRSLLALHRNGISPNGRIIGSPSPDPLLAASPREVRRFQDRIHIIDRIGETDPQKIAALAGSP